MRMEMQWTGPSLIRAGRLFWSRRAFLCGENRILNILISLPTKVTKMNEFIDRIGIYTASESL